MIITDDGVFAHNILSPNKHVSKKYNVTITEYLTAKYIYAMHKEVNLWKREKN